MTDEIEIEENFAVVPEWLLRADLPADAKVIYSALQRLASTGQKMPGRAELAKHWLYKSPSAVSRATTALEQYGALDVRRDTVPVGQSGRMITRNTYYLRTSDPRISHLKPARSSAPVAYSTSELGHPRSPSKGLEDLSLTTNAGETRPARSFQAVVVEITDADQAILGDLLELAAELRQVRRDDIGKSDRAWSDVNVARAVVEAIAAGYDVDLIRPALLALVRDPDTIVPQRLKVAGAWWDHATGDAFRQRRHASAQAARDAIGECDQCDEYGWLLPDAERRCDHVARTEVC